MEMTRGRRAALAVVLAALGCVGLVRTQREPGAGLDPAGLFTLAALTALFFAAAFLTLKAADRRAWRFALPLGALFGLCAACGAEYFQLDRLDFSPVGLGGKLLSVLCLTGAFGAVAAAVILWLPRAAGGKTGRLSPAKTFLVSWAVILLCWLPCFIAFFPGIFAYDIPTQIIGISTGALSDDHPLLHTLIAWGCLRLGATLRSYSMGAALYTLIQTLALSASFAACVGYLRRLNAGRVWLWLSLAWFALLPIHPLFAVNATKDVLFTACTVFYLLFVAELARRPDRCLRSPKFWAGYIAVLLAMCLMRKTGLPAAACFIPVLLLLLPGRRKRALALCLASLVLFFGSYAGLKSAMGAYRGRFTEGLSVPLQQMARCAHDGALDEEELAELEVYIPRQVWQVYSSRLADQVKNDADREAIKADPAGVIRLWVRLGLRHPGCYINAFLGLNIGYWYPDMEYPDARTWHAYIECDSKQMGDEIRITDLDLWPAARAFYRGIGMEASFENLPLLDLLFKPGIYFWGTLCALAAALYHRRRTAAAVSGFLAVSWLLHFLSPIALLRYAYPFMASLPLAAGLTEPDIGEDPPDLAAPKEI